ncbi:anti-anti-sigma factor [Actinokineospora alba]|uniref:Anti-anti-sigma factor n=2 Tax=Actinokineospora alba TaxID=504798 RepID=A0A1H0G4A9_9PSEU|nr:STAS domain-containing protein [Actinokineospora alba]TDP69757.1 anti-anti-sigma factor [Actinokineospora alba]SDI09409.1 anti-anti-sigma factor [Actinokineospora alba]SDO01753.1 anti-anti-sigma factor [Actinokineospora alba]
MSVVSEPGAPRREVGGLLVTGSALPGGVFVVRVVGEVDTATAATLVTGIDDALDRKPAVLVVDLSEVAFFGSVGISALIEADRRTKCPMRVVVTPAIRRILGIVGFDALLDLYDTLDEANAAA